MDNIFEKLIETEFEDTFKPADKEDVAKRIETASDYDLYMPVLNYISELDEQQFTGLYYDWAGVTEPTSGDFADALMSKGIIKAFYKEVILGIKEKKVVEDFEDTFKPADKKELMTRVDSMSDEDMMESDILWDYLLKLSLDELSDLYDNLYGVRPLKNVIITSILDSTGSGNLKELLKKAISEL